MMDLNESTLTRKQIIEKSINERMCKMDFHLLETQPIKCVTILNQIDITCWARSRCHWIMGLKLRIVIYMDANIALTDA